MQVSKAFSHALAAGASSEELEEYKNRIRQISRLINEKYDAARCGDGRGRTNEIL